VSIEERVLISKLMESYNAKYHDMNGSRYNKDNDYDGKYPEINLLHDRSVNKVITGTRNSIKRQSRYLSAGAPCHFAVSQSTRPVARALKTRTRSSLLSPRWIQACARTVHIFFSSSRIFVGRIIRDGNNCIAGWNILPSLSLSSYSCGNRCKKIFHENGGRDNSFSGCAGYFFEKKGKGEKETAAWLRWMYTVSYRESLSGRSNCHWNCVRFATGEKGKSAE